MGAAHNSGGAALEAVHKASPAVCDRQRMLIVDDDGAVLRAFSAIIRNALPDVQVDQAANGAEAVELFRERRHRVVIMDLFMPVMDGVTSFGRIRALCEAESWDMPAVLFCTGYAPPDTVQRLVEGDSRHLLLLKPVNGADIVEAVRSRLD